MLRLRQARQCQHPAVQQAIWLTLRQPKDSWLFAASSLPPLCHCLDSSSATIMHSCSSVPVGNALPRRPVLRLLAIGGDGGACVREVAPQQLDMVRTSVGKSHEQQHQADAQLSFQQHPLDRAASCWHAAQSKLPAIASALDEVQSQPFQQPLAYTCSSRMCIAEQGSKSGGWHASQLRPMKQSSVAHPDARSHVGRP